MDTAHDPAAGERPSHFLREIVEADLEAGRHTEVVTRFPPEPNGFLHIGHAKAICLDFGIAADYGGRCHLRFDDTNPTTEDTLYVEAIQDDVRWLGFAWDRLCFASDYFEDMYRFAEQLVERGLAYVDSSSAEDIREMRGTPYEPGRESPYRDRPVAESLDLLRRMRAGEFPDGAHVLRARIDMASPNIVMRDPTLYRIRHARHHRTGDDWCIYPMYDFAHCLEDAIEGVTHSFCTLEFEINRELYDWVLDHVDAPSRPHQYEFARLALAHTVLSKRKLVQLVEEGHVGGWDDPRLPTLAGLRRRGVPPGAIRAFCEMVGVARTDSVVDVGKLEYCTRDALNTEAPRVMGVLRPLEVEVTTFPAGEVDELDAPSWPDDVGKPGSRPVPFTRTLYIERDDFAEEPLKGWKRLSPGREVRLRYGYVVRCDEVVKDERGEVVALRCSHDPGSRGGRVPDGRKVKGTIHWVSADRSLPAEVRLYDRLFVTERPGSAEGADFREELNPESLVVLEGARVEPGLAAIAPGERVQFERQGYFVADAHDSREGHLVFNRIVTLKDGWARRAQAAGAGARGAGAGGGPEGGPRRVAGRGDVVSPAADRSARPASGAAPERDAARAADPELAARRVRYRDELGLSPSEADILSGDRALSDLFEAALATHPRPAPVARWTVNEVLREAKDRGVAALPFGGAELGELAAMVDGGEITAAAGKEVFAVIAAEGGAPRAIAGRLGLGVASDDELVAAVDGVLGDHPEEVQRYRDGEGKLLGFFMGQLRKATRGAADPQRARELLQERLGSG